MFLNEFLLWMTEIDLVFDILLMLIIAKKFTLCKNVSYYPKNKQKKANLSLIIPFGKI